MKNYLKTKEGKEINSLIEFRSFLFKKNIFLGEKCSWVFSKEIIFDNKECFLKRKDKLKELEIRDKKTNTLLCHLTFKNNRAIGLYDDKKRPIYDADLIFELDRKYKLTKESIKHKSHTLYRIEATCNFGDVKKGDKGGFVESYFNLCENGWVNHNAKVYGNALVFGNAVLYNNAEVYGNSRIFEKAKVSGDAKIFGDVMIRDEAHISTTVKICGNSIISGKTRLYGDAKIFGDLGVFEDVGFLIDEKFEGAKNKANKEITIFEGLDYLNKTKEYAKQKKNTKIWEALGGEYLFKNPSSFITYTEKPSTNNIWESYVFKIDKSFGKSLIDEENKRIFEKDRLEKDRLEKALIKKAREKQNLEDYKVALMMEIKKINDKISNL